MKCPKCNTELPEGTKFCIKCGYNLQTSICPKCKKALRPGAKFCTYCGTSLDSQGAEEPDSGNENNKKRMIVIVVIIAAVVVACLIWFLMKSDFGNDNSPAATEKTEVSDISDSSEESVDEEEPAEYQLIMSESLTFTEAGEEQEIEYETNIEDPSEIKWTTEDETIATVGQDGLVTAVGAGETVIYACWNDLETSCKIICEIDEDEPDSQFTVDSDIVSDYSANLDPDEYLCYDSEDFTFYYPASLYNYGAEDLESYTTETGVNVRDVLLEGDDGITAAHFNKSVRTDEATDEEMLQDVYDYYGSLLHGMSDISYSEENLRFIITGYFDSGETEAAYILVRVDGEFVYCMEIIFPYNGDSSSEDYLEKSYVVENIYRMCSFSGSSYKARTYTQFLNGEQGDKY